MRRWMAALALLASSAVALAQAERGVVSVGGEELFRIQAGSGGYTAAQRAEQVMDRLAELLSEPFPSPGDVRVVPVDGGMARLLVGRQLLVTVTHADGRPNGLSAIAQASRWADGVRRYLARVTGAPSGETLGIGAVTGSVTHRARIALPPTTVVEVVLEEVSRADAPAVLVGRQTFRIASQQPFPFRIPYRSGSIRPDRHYAVRARLLIGGAVRFASTRRVPVLTMGHPSEGLEVEVQPTGRRR